MKAADDVRLPVLPQTPLAFLIQRLDVLASAGHDIPPEHELHLALKSAEDLFEIKKFDVWGNVITLKAADAHNSTLADDFECVRWYLLKAMTAPEESELFSMLLENWSSAVMAVDWSARGLVCPVCMALVGLIGRLVSCDCATFPGRDAGGTVFLFFALTSSVRRQRLHHHRI